MRIYIWASHRELECTRDKCNDIVSLLLSSLPPDWMRMLGSAHFPLLEINHPEFVVLWGTVKYGDSCRIPICFPIPWDSLWLKTPRARRYNMFNVLNITLCEERGCLARRWCPHQAVIWRDVHLLTRCTSDLMNIKNYYSVLLGVILEIRGRFHC